MQANQTMAAGGTRVVCKMGLTIFNHKSSNMKKYFLILGLTAVLAGGYSCKGKNDKATDTTTTTTATPAPTTTAPVEISGDEELRKGVTDATKDYPGVNATVSDGVITLTGTIEKDKFVNLKQSLDALRPKQVVNNLQYK